MDIACAVRGFICILARPPPQLQQKSNLYRFEELVRVFTRRTHEHGSTCETKTNTELDSIRLRRVSQIKSPSTATS
jgi:hypothetical protein